MFLIKCNIFLSVTVLVLSSNVNREQRKFIQSNNFYYPEERPNTTKVTHDRKPVLDRTRCKENEYLYPGDNLSDWTCDCKPGFIFNPSDATCYEAYRKGPCKYGDILVLSKPKKSPKCIPNQCKKDGHVYYKGKCHPLDSTEPCKQFNYLIGRKTFLTVKESNFELICADNDNIFECNGMCCNDSRGNQSCFKRKQKTSNTRSKILI